MSTLHFKRKNSSINSGDTRELRSVTAQTHENWSTCRSPGKLHYRHQTTTLLQISVWCQARFQHSVDPVSRATSSIAEQVTLRIMHKKTNEDSCRRQKTLGATARQRPETKTSYFCTETVGYASTIIPETRLLQPLPVTLT
jgi:hypothetical protein